MVDRYVAPDWVMAEDTTRSVAVALNCSTVDGWAILQDAIRNGEIRSRYCDKYLSLQSMAATGDPSAARQLEYVGREPTPRDWAEKDFLHVHYAEVHRASLHEWLKRHEPAVVSGKKRGRPTSYDWEGALAHLGRYVGLHGRPQRPGTLVEIARDWFIERTDDHPGRTQLRKRVVEKFYR